MENTKKNFGLNRCQQRGFHVGPFTKIVGSPEHWKRCDECKSIIEKI